MFRHSQIPISSNFSFLQVFLLSIVSLLTDSNPDDPLRPEIVQINKKDIDS